MYKKIFIGIITMAISIVSGVRGFQYVRDNSVEVGVVAETNEEENIVEDTTIEEVEKTNEKLEDIPEEKEEKIIENNTETLDNSDSTIANKETKVIEKEKTSGQKSNNTEVKSDMEAKDNKSNMETKDIKCNVETKDSTIKSTSPNIEAQKTEQKTKEEYIYNDTATQKIINDINTIAKRNPDLWGKNGEKLYKIEKSPNLVGKNYMYPYSYGQVEGKVLNVYSVTFLVYAVDYKKTGFATETRYYIDITSFKK